MRTAAGIYLKVSANEFWGLVANLQTAVAACACVSAGVIPIAHNSGGPQADIVVDVQTDAGPQQTGYLAATLEEYCRAITTVLEMEQRDRLTIAAAAQRRAATMFSTENFHKAFVDAIRPILPKFS